MDGIAANSSCCNDEPSTGRVCAASSGPTISSQPWNREAFSDDELQHLRGLSLSTLGPGVS